jgi:aminoglycoside phosphotransferase (APT) family kinase protein
MIPVAKIATALGLQDPEVTELHGGLSNRSWRLRDAKQDLVLRQSGAGSDILGSDPRSELAMQAIAATAGLAPPIVLARPADGLLVTRYIDGNVLSRDDVREPAMLARIGDWVARLHALAPPQGLAIIDLGSRAEGYLQSPGGKLPSAFRQALRDGLADRRKATPPPDRFAACHHDLHHLNLVDRGDSLIALDWEYAGPGDPAADLAACICYHDLDPQRVDALLAGYGDGTEALRARLVPLCWIFDCLWLGWLEMAATLDISLDAGRRQRLVERLSS